MDTIDRYRGSLLGLAAGDALGTTLEFRQPGSFQPVSDMVGGGPFRLKAGQWTDDTALALCLAESLIEHRGFDPVDQLKRYCDWFRNGHLSSTGDCFDIGNTTRAALIRLESTGEDFCGSTSPSRAGNGSIMRLAPVPLFFACDPQSAIEKSGESSRTTHGAVECIDACRNLGALIVAAVNGVSKNDFLNSNYSPVPGYWKQHPLAPAVAAIADGSFQYLEPPEIKGTGYVVQSLEAALWAFYKTDNFRDGALLAVNLGDDADTTGAVYGQLAGAYYGANAIPENWRKHLALRKTIEVLADKLHGLSRTPAATSNREE